MGDTLNEAVESHLRANGDWNINDWRDVASALAGRVRELEAKTFQGHSMEGQWYSHRELLMILRALGASEPQIDKALALAASGEEQE